MLLIVFILILFLVIFVPSLLLSIVARILDIFSFGRKRPVNHSDDEQHYSQQSHNEHGTRDTYNHRGEKRRRKKIFDKNEGEYVDFEEIK